MTIELMRWQVFLGRSVLIEGIKLEQKALLMTSMRIITWPLVLFLQLLSLNGSVGQ